ncbi:MAG: phosphate/phosphite/phosphonate ABC transporter substrate-binding protein, partial [Luteimonas sp.]
MRTIRTRLLACLIMPLAGVLGALAPYPAVAAADPRVLVLGCVSDDPKADYEQLKPLLDYVVPRLADVGVREGRILMARDIQQMGSYLRRGRVDWVTGSVATGLQLQMRSGALPLLLTQRNGAGNDHTLFFVRRESPLVSVQDLRGHSIVFKNTMSPGAYFVPAMQLLQQGMVLQRLLSPMDHPDAATVGFVLAGSDLNLATWVRRGLVDVGAIGARDWENPQRMPPPLRDGMRIIGETADYPLALEVSRGDIDA